MSLDELKDIVIATAQHEFGSELDFGKLEVAPSSDSIFGDFATNAALVYASQLKKSPTSLAQRLATSLERAVPNAKKVEVAGPGFINITMSTAHWVDQLSKIDSDYGRSRLGHGTKVQVEYISANPTGPLTIGNARNGFLGDVISNVLHHSGYEVVREYYFNDAGTQISKLLESVKMEAGVLPESEERQYRGAYIKQLASQFDHELKTESDDRLKKLLTQEIIAQYIKPGVEAMGIHFDSWFNEMDLIEGGLFQKTVHMLDERGLIFRKDGAVWLKTGELGDTRSERVLIKSTGVPTYMAPDIAYHVNIFDERQFDYAIKVLGPDHIAQFPSVYAAVHALFPDKRLRMAAYQWLRIVSGGKELKVSKRLGQFITVQDLIDEVSMPVARFLILMRAADSHMDFDLDLAREESAKNPYYYVMYAYARANSILERAATRGLAPAKVVHALDSHEVALAKHMSRLPEMIALMSEDFGVHRLTFYGLELAKLFTEYYESSRFIELPATEAEAKLFVVEKYVVFMEVYWALLGLEPQKRMEH